MQKPAKSRGFHLLVHHSSCECSRLGSSPSAPVIYDVSLGLSRLTPAPTSASKVLPAKSMAAGLQGGTVTTTYPRQDAKSGGHCVGWIPITPYSFKVPNEGWQEAPVSIADLGGTAIDLRFASSQAGNISVIVAPVLRFSDSLGDNASIVKVGSLEKVITALDRR